MRVELEGRVALVTGAGQGIGRAIALAFAENGAFVAINDVCSNGEDTAAEIHRRGKTAKFYQADVGDAKEVNQMVAAVEQDRGRIDILVNNAAVYTAAVEMRLPIHQYLDSDWDKILRVNLDGVFFCSRAVSAGMVKRKKGTIINLSSVLGIVPLRLQCAYNTAKASVISLTRCQALEVGAFGVRVNAIAPGSIHTDATRQAFYNSTAQGLADSLLSHIPLGRAGEVQDIANAALYLASDDAGYVTGHVLVVDGGWTAGYMRDW
jgi:3-oxoacyl-[acyl-carrier protein] reductase